MRNKLFSVSIMLVLILALLVSVSSADTPVTLSKAEGKEVGNQVAPLLNKDAANAVPGQYIVVFKDGTSKAMANQVKADVAREHGNAIQAEWTVVNGFSAKMSDASVAALQKNPNVKYVEQDVYVTVNENPNSWGLDRIDQRDLPLDNSWLTGLSDGSGVHVYIVDTGIRMTHVEFAGMTFGNGYDFIDNDSDYSDCHGHGTHVAGTAVGQNHGIARGATLHGVRVLNCQGSGTGTQVINGINWVANNAILPAVANMSLGGGYSATENNAVNNAVAAGVVFAVAAGNENTDACTKSPASATDALTVAASTSADARSSFSNYGSCVDLFAPGSSITSSTNDSDTSTASWNGTSMASPHVAGVAALFLGDNPSWTPAQVRAAMIDDPNTGTSSGRLSGVNGSPNELLYWGTELDTAPPPTPTPVPGDCTGYNNSLAGSLSGTGVSEYWTYSSKASGSFEGDLTGPGGTDFDLYLQRSRKSSGPWTTVASSLSATSNEYISYSSGSSYYFRWQVYSYSGSGNYTLCANP